MNSGAMTRRDTLRLSLGTVGAVALGGTAALAAPDLKGRTVVFASWGGAYQEAEKVCYCDPFAKATGARVIQDGPMNNAKFRAMMEAGTPDWDVVDITLDYLHAGVPENFFERIDTGIVDTSRIDPRFVHEYGIGCIVWSYNLARNTKAYAGKAAPRTWADLFDLKRFPGKRTLSDIPTSSLEVALLADGVPADKLYPLDLDRAFRKLDTIKAQTIFWSSNSQSQQLFIDGEVNLGLILNGRAYDASKKGAPIAVSWEQNIQSVDFLVVPRGSRNREAAMHLIDTMTRPENQAKLANMIAYAPTNPAAIASVDPALKPWLSTTPENIDKGFVVDAEYWRDHQKSNQERWTAWKVS